VAIQKKLHSKKASLHFFKTKLWLRIREETTVQHQRLLSSFPIREHKVADIQVSNSKGSSETNKVSKCFLFSIYQKKRKEKQRNTHLPILRHTVAPSPSGCARDNSLLTTTLGLLNCSPVPFPLSALSIIPLT
jgi:hypothetical protein